jgi:hypothetical protein
VKPRRSGPWSSRTSAWRTTPPTAAFLPFAAARRNSARRVRRFGLRALRDGEGESIGAGVRAGMEGTPAVGPALRRTGACGPWRGARPALCGRLPFPCGRGNHAGACGRVLTADTCASQQLLREPTGRCVSAVFKSCKRPARQRASGREGGLYGRARRPSTTSAGNEPRDHIGVGRRAIRLCGRRRYDYKIAGIPGGDHDDRHRQWRHGRPGTESR